MSSSHFCYQHREQQQQPSSHLSLQYFFCKGSWKATFLQQERKFALAFGQVCFCFRSFFLLFSQLYWQMKSGKKYSSSKSNQESSHSSLIDIIQICKKWNVNYALQTVCVQKFFQLHCSPLKHFSFFRLAVAEVQQSPKRIYRLQSFFSDQVSCLALEKLTRREIPFNWCQFAQLSNEAKLSDQIGKSRVSLSVGNQPDSYLLY